MERAFKGIFAGAAALAVASVGTICLFLILEGAPAIGRIGLGEFLAGTSWRPSENVFGILPMLAGSGAITLGAALLGVPIGILTAVFLAAFCPKGLDRLVRPAVTLMAGIPSVVYGFFGLMTIVPLVRDVCGGRGMCILSASILLAMMILPTVIVVAEAALKAVPTTIYEGALALGATHERSIFAAVLPAAKSGVWAAVVLGIGRAVGETMAVIMVAGNQPLIPTSLLKGVRTLTTNVVLEMGYATDLHREALIATALVLFVLTLALNGGFSFLKRR